MIRTTVPTTVRKGSALLGVAGLLVLAGCSGTGDAQSPSTGDNGFNITVPPGVTITGLPTPVPGTNTPPGVCSLVVACRCLCVPGLAARVCAPMGVRCLLLTAWSCWCRVLLLHSHLHRSEPRSGRRLCDLVQRADHAARQHHLVSAACWWCAVLLLCTWVW